MEFVKQPVDGERDDEKLVLKSKEACLYLFCTGEGGVITDASDYCSRLLGACVCVCECRGQREDASLSLLPVWFSVIGHSSNVFFSPLVSLQNFKTYIDV